MNRPLTFCGLGALGLAVIAYFGLVHDAVDVAMEHTATDFDIELRLEPNQKATAELPRVSTLYVWHVYDFSRQGEDHRVDRRLPSGVTLRILGPGGETIAIDEASGDSQMAVNGRHAYLIGTFEAASAGEYSFEVRESEMRGDGQVRYFDVSSTNPIAVISSLAGGCFGIVICGVLALGGLVMLIVGLALQDKNQPA
ncbi:MAG: hypothetical protein NXI31_10310 [bacterium]|nr:hypothetical protein [bacterium]